MTFMDGFHEKADAEKMEKYKKGRIKTDLQSIIRPFLVSQCVSSPARADYRI